MSTATGLQLLKIPSSGKENAPAAVNPKPGLLKPPSSKPFQLLSMPVPVFKDMGPKLYILPGAPHAKPHDMSLLKLPRSRMPVSAEHQNIEQGFNQNKCHFPLLKKPDIKQQISLVKLPVKSEMPLEIPRLIQIPLGQNSDILPSKSKQTGPDSHWGPPPNPRLSGAKNLNDAECEMLHTDQSLPRGQSLKRKRRRKKPNAPVQNVNAQSRSHRHEYSHSASYQNDEKHNRKEVFVSQSTQTVFNDTKIGKGRQKKASLMALLEHAAMLDLTGASSSEEEDVAFQVLRNRPLVKDLNKGSSGLKDRQTMGSEPRQASLEDLLLQNFEDDSRGRMLTKAPTQRYSSKEQRGALAWEQSRESESKTKAGNTSSIPNPVAIEKPKTSVGPSWKNLIDLANGVTSNEVPQSSVPSLRDVGVQASESVPAIDKIEQISQTDFTGDGDVERMLLDNFSKRGDGREVLPSHDVPSKELDSAKGEKYPWQYIPDTDFSDLNGANVKSEQGVKARVVEGSQHEDLRPSIADDTHEEVKGSMGSRPVVAKSSRCHAPLEVFLGMQVKEDCVEVGAFDSAELGRPLNIVEISRSPSPIVANEPVERVMIRDIPLEMLQESFGCVTEASNNNINLRKQKFEAFESNEDDIRNAPEEPTLAGLASGQSGIEASSFAPSHSRELKERALKAAAEATRLNDLLTSGPKNRMHNNLRNMSVQLDALDELYEHLRKELKDSAVLMQTVDTLHQGFFEEPKPMRKVSPMLSLDRNIFESERVAAERFSSTPVDHGSKVPAEASKEEEIVSTGANADEGALGGWDLEAGIGEDGAQPNADSDGSEHLVEEEQMESLDNSDYLSTNYQEDAARESVRLAMSADISKNSRRSSNSSMNGDLDERDVVRQRIASKHPDMSTRRREEDAREKEMELKLKIEKKRQSLREWMNKKKTERNEKYLMEVEEKRQRESRPFVSTREQKSLVASKRSGKYTKEVLKLKKEVDKVAYKERMDGAQQLLDEILAVRSDALGIEKASAPHDTVKGRRKPRAQNRQNAIRSNPRQAYRTKESYTRKSTTARTKGPGKGLSNKRNSLGAETSILDKMATSWKYSEVAEEERFLKEMGIDLRELAASNEDPSFLGPSANDLNPYSSTARSGSNRYKLNLGSPTDRPFSEIDTSRSKGRRSVEGKDFVTEKSMEVYRRKTAKLIRESLKKYGEEELSESLVDNILGKSHILVDSDDFNDSEKLILEGILNDKRDYEEDDLIKTKRQRTRSPAGSDADVQGILREYGLLDQDLEKYDMLETKMILAEADAALDAVDVRDEADNSTGSIDWNEINNILKQN